MQLNDIIAMCNAGFSAKQIASMVELETQQTAAAPQIQQTAAAPQIQQQFNEILAAIRGSNLNAAEQPQQQTSDQILASIINPPTNKEV